MPEHWAEGLDGGSGSTACPCCRLPVVAMMTRQGPAFTCLCTHPELRGRHAAWIASGGRLGADGGEEGYAKEKAEERMRERIAAKLEAFSRAQEANSYGTEPPKATAKPVAKKKPAFSEILVAVPRKGKRGRGAAT